MYVHGSCASVGLSSRVRAFIYVYVREFVLLLLLCVLVVVLRFCDSEFSEKQY